MLNIWVFMMNVYFSFFFLTNLHCEITAKKFTQKIWLCRSLFSINGCYLFTLPEYKGGWKNTSGIYGELNNRLIYTHWTLQTTEFTCKNSLHFSFVWTKPLRLPLSLHSHSRESPRCRVCLSYVFNQRLWLFYWAIVFLLSNLSVY